MLTKEIENIAKALPSFVTMTESVKDPLWIPCCKADDKISSLEAVSKSIWFITPFHFATFYGLVSPNFDSVTYVVLGGLAVLIALMWIGALAAFLIGRHKVKYDIRAGVWVSGLTFSWFLSMLTLSLCNIFQWSRGEDWDWPPITNLFSSFLSNILGLEAPERGEVILALAFFAALVGAIGTVVISNKRRINDFKGKVRWRFTLFPFCVFLISFFLISMSANLLSPA